MYFFNQAPYRKIGTKNPNPIAETSLGPEFPAGWAGKKTKRLRNKAEALKQKVRSTARKVYENHFREAQSQPRGVVAKLTQIVQLVEKACQKQVINESEWKILMTSALEELTELLGDESKVCYRALASFVYRMNFT